MPPLPRFFPLQVVYKVTYVCYFKAILPHYGANQNMEVLWFVRILDITMARPACPTCPFFLEEVVLHLPENLCEMIAMMIADEWESVGEAIRGVAERLHPYA